MLRFLASFGIFTSNTPQNDKTTLCFIALGSNLDSPIQQLRRARESISQLGQLGSQSSIYRSAPMKGGPEGQDDYFNALVSLRTELSVRELLSKLQAIEKSQGRQRKLRWAARTIDLDIISYGDLTIDEKGLTVPHPGTMNRSFVLIPLAEINPVWVHPMSGKPVKEAITDLGDFELKRTEEQLDRDL